MFWCYQQGVDSFQFYRPVILVDGTFRSGKYRDVLTMAVAVDPENQLVSMAFALTKGETKESWNWFMNLLRRHVIGRRNDKIFLISDRHAGILNAAKRVIDGTNHLSIGGACGTSLLTSLSGRRTKISSTTSKNSVVQGLSVASTGCGVS